MKSMPDDTFDPLAEWLGIPPAEQPPHHYRLLGLKLFEDRAEAIERAADERMAAVRKHQTGRRAAATQQVLNRLAAAKQCLLNSATRTAYDAAIRGQLEAAKSAAAGRSQPRWVEQPPALDFEAPPLDPVTGVGIAATESGTSTQRGRPVSAGMPRRPGNRLLMLLSIGLTMFTICAGAWVLFGPNRENREPPKRPVVIVKRPPADRAAKEEAPPIVRPEGGVLRCTAENVEREHAARRAGDVLDVTLVDGRVEVSWTVRVRKVGFYVPTITYAATGDAGQTFEIEMADAALRTTPIRNTAGRDAADELKAVALRKTGDQRVVLRAAGRVDPSRTIKVRRLEFRPVGLPPPTPDAASSSDAAARDR